MIPSQQDFSLEPIVHNLPIARFQGNNGKSHSPFFVQRAAIFMFRSILVFVNDVFDLLKTLHTLPEKINRTRNSGDIRKKIEKRYPVM